MRGRKHTLEVSKIFNNGGTGLCAQSTNVSETLMKTKNVKLICFVILIKLHVFISRFTFFLRAKIYLTTN